jgi:hypothetical protein
MSLLGTVEHLAGAIGPRASATPAEQQAADWVTAELAAFGHAPQQQTFVSETSQYWPLIFAAGATLLSVFFFWQTQPVGAGAAAVLAGVALVLLLLHLRGRSTLLRWLTPNNDSRNVVVTMPASAPSQPPILITANLDSPRATPGASRPVLLLTLAGMGALVALALLGIPNNAIVLRQIALIPAAIALVLLVQMILAQRAPFTAGANGNASGVAVALDLAGRLAQQPTTRRNVIIAFTGCGEVHAAGLEALLKARAAELQGAVHLAISHADGSGALALIRREAFTATVESDPRLVALGEKVAKACGIEAPARDFTLAHGEMSAGVQHGLRSMGLMRLDSAGVPANWRSAGDMPSALDEAPLQQTADFAWQLVQAIDTEA